MVGPGGPPCAFVAKPNCSVRRLVLDTQNYASTKNRNLNLNIGIEYINILAWLDCDLFEGTGEYDIYTTPIASF